MRLLIPLIVGLLVGQASFYADRFEGRPTASGEAYHGDLFTCAHASLPLGTILEVYCPETGRSVDVIVNDRGPFEMDGFGRPLYPLRPHPTRAVDLSRAAFSRLAPLSRGVIEVEIN